MKRDIEGRNQEQMVLMPETLENFVMYLIGHLLPDFKSIADFRRDNGIHKACKRFIAHRRELDLFRYTAVAIDSSKFKDVNSRDKKVTPHKLEQHIKPIVESNERYVHALSIADRMQPDTHKVSCSQQTFFNEEIKSSATDKGRPYRASRLRRSRSLRRC